MGRRHHHCFLVVLGRLHTQIISDWQAFQRTKASRRRHYSGRRKNDTDFPRHGVPQELGGSHEPGKYVGRRKHNDPHNRPPRVGQQEQSPPRFRAAQPPAPDANGRRGRGSVGPQDNAFPTRYSRHLNEERNRSFLEGRRGAFKVQHRRNNRRPSAVTRGTEPFQACHLLCAISSSHLLSTSGPDSLVMRCRLLCIRASRASNGDDIHERIAPVTVLRRANATYDLSTGV